jgi:hypothetical protein
MGKGLVDREEGLSQSNGPSSSSRDRSRYMVFLRSCWLGYRGEEK